MTPHSPGRMLSVSLSWQAGSSEEHRRAEDSANGGGSLPCDPFYWDSESLHLGTPIHHTYFVLHTQTPVQRSAGRLTYKEHAARFSLPFVAHLPASPVLVATVLGDMSYLAQSSVCPSLYIRLTVEARYSPTMYIFTSHHARQRSRTFRSKARQRRQRVSPTSQLGPSPIRVSQGSLSLYRVDGFLIVLLSTDETREISTRYQSRTLLSMPSSLPPIASQPEPGHFQIPNNLHPLLHSAPGVNLHREGAVFAL
ncbi:hypothetical protein F4778DRAFT_82555 [Xylariomycetidae sp. FL2044]|nr:hypothetical protein F4778DRAFT_82555 [Xylariomycetidae sp. FL2044]